VNGQLLPGSTTIGVLGSGQLGRMLTFAARRMGYAVHVFSPEEDSPAGRIANREYCAPYEDLDAAREFALGVDVITLEFENIPSEPVEELSSLAPVRPGIKALQTTQNRLREKEFLRGAGFPVAPFRAVPDRGSLGTAIKEVGVPAVLKTAGFGYDGKGQTRISSPEDGDGAWEALGGEAVLEAWVDFEAELSVVAARGLDGSFAHYGAVRNTHDRHILDLTVSPSGVPFAVEAEAVEITAGIFEALGIVGTSCVEFFLTKDEELLVNEIAPRPHNSGHWTIEGAATSQFEQQLRAVCNLPLGSTHRPEPAAMSNLLGDLWQAGEPDWPAALAVPGTSLHLYGKKQPRPGRKMGHITARAPTPEQAARRALEARKALTKAES
jgi:5-(carboxyamino)imidazole ribonucleotide synthase